MIIKKRLNPFGRFSSSNEIKTFMKEGSSDILSPLLGNRQARMSPNSTCRRKRGVFSGEFAVVSQLSLLGGAEGGRGGGGRVSERHTHTRACPWDMTARGSPSYIPGTAKDFNASGWADVRCFCKGRGESTAFFNVYFKVRVKWTRRRYYGCCYGSRRGGRRGGALSTTQH